MDLLDLCVDEDDGFEPDRTDLDRHWSSYARRSRDMEESEAAWCDQREDPKESED